MEDKGTILHSRIEYIDFYKGIGILLMVMGHVYFGKKFNILIHAFHMPMFFFVTGFMFQSKRPISMFIKKKIQALIVPYLLYGFMSLSIYGIINHRVPYSEFMHLFWINTEGLAVAGALWFLTAMFISSLIYYAIDKFIQRWAVKAVVVISITTIGFITSLLPTRLPWAVDVGLVSVFFVFCGNCIRLIVQSNTKQMSKSSHKQHCLLMWGGVLICIITIILIFANGEVNMREGSYSNPLLFLVNAAIASLILWVASYAICHGSFRPIVLLKQGLSYIGKNSIVFLGLNQILIYIFTELMSGAVPKLLLKVSTLLFTLAILSLISIIVNKLKINILLGKSVHCHD